MRWARPLDFGLDKTGTVPRIGLSRSIRAPTQQGTPRFVAGTMARDAMKGALDNLARNAIVQQIKLAMIPAPVKV